MSLSDTALRGLKVWAKDTKLTDGRGLYLLVKTTGGRLWRLNYRFNGKYKTLSLGPYPDIGLKDARERADEARKLLVQGIDPGAARKAAKVASEARAANTFEALAGSWFARWKEGKADPGKAWARLETYVFPWLGAVPVADIKPVMVLDGLKTHVEAVGKLDTLRKIKSYVSQIMRHAIQVGIDVRDPCPDLRGAFKKGDVKHYASITDPVKVGALMRAIDGYTGFFSVRAALRIAPLVFVRPGELRAARWAEIDLDAGTWSYFIGKTKTEHLVPLPRQAVAILRDLFSMTGGGDLVFPGAKAGKELGNTTLNQALRGMGYDTQKDITGHGFRALARTLLAEQLDQTPEWIEHQLGHAVPDNLGTAYNRTKYLKQRREMMQVWADYLDKLKAGADVIPLMGNVA
jgi:integrase